MNREDDKKTNLEEKTKTIEQEIRFVAFLDSDNNPLLHQIFYPDSKDMNEEIKYQKIMRCSFLSEIASVVENGDLVKPYSGKNNDAFKLVFVDDNIEVYHYSNRVTLQIIVGLENLTKSPKTMENHNEILIQKNKIIKDIFMDFHFCYIKTICNPFFFYLNNQDNDENDPKYALHANKSFEKNISNLVSSWNKVMRL